MARRFLPGTPRGQLALALLACVAGAALAFYAASRNWTVHQEVRPAPLPPVRTARTGTDLVPWVPALALVALAGAGALVATRRLGRPVVGVLVALSGLGVAAGAVLGLVRQAGAAGSTGPGWPLAALAGGLVAAGAGALAVRHGRSWPALGARYENPAGSAGRRRADPADPAGAWDALDRGEDPTTG